MLFGERFECFSERFASFSARGMLRSEHFCHAIKGPPHGGRRGGPGPTTSAASRPPSSRAGRRADERLVPAAVRRKGRAHAVLAA